MQQARIEEKIAAGARFFQTQAIFDVDKLARATELAHRCGAKVIAGILVLRSPRVIRFINERLAGLMVPEHVAKRIERASECEAEAVVLATEQAAEYAEVADGVHVMALGLDAAVPSIVHGAGIRA